MVCFVVENLVDYLPSDFVPGDFLPHPAFKGRKQFYKDGSTLAYDSVLGGVITRHLKYDFLEEYSALVTPKRLHVCGGYTIGRYGKWKEPVPRNSQQHHELHFQVRRQRSDDSGCEWHLERRAWDPVTGEKDRLYHHAHLLGPGRCNPGVDWKTAAGHFRDSENLVFANCLFENWYRGVIFGWGIKNVYFENCTFRGLGRHSSGSESILFEGQCENITLQGCHFDNCYVGAVFNRSAKNVAIDSCAAVNCPGGLVWLTPGRGQVIEEVYIRNCESVGGPLLRVSPGDEWGNNKLGRVYLKDNVADDQVYFNESYLGKGGGDPIALTEPILVHGCWPNANPQFDRFGEKARPGISDDGVFGPTQPIEYKVGDTLVSRSINVKVKL